MFKVSKKSEQISIPSSGCLNLKKKSVFPLQKICFGSDINVLRKVPKNKEKICPWPLCTGIIAKYPYLERLQKASRLPALRYIPARGGSRPP
jgi:hypothetical protein